MSSQNAVVSAQEVEATTPVLTLVPTTPTVCQPGDTECVKRWIEAFSDCD